MHEQMMIRISKTIQDTSVKLSFVERQIKKSNSVIDGLLFTQLLSDWISSKITSNWLRSFYTPWLENPILSGQGSSKLNLLKSFPITQTFLQLFGNNEWPHKLQDIVAKAPENEDDVLQGLHFLLLQGVVHFGEKTNDLENFEIKIARGRKIHENLKSKDHYEVLGVSQNARHSEIHRAYHELAKNFHPDKTHPQSPIEYRNLTQKIFTLMTEAYQILSHETKRKNYDKTLEMGRAEEVLATESQFEEALRHLRSNRHREARKILEIVMMKRGSRSDVMVYYIWALIKEKRQKIKPEELAKKVNHYLNKVAHEDRHSPQYFFIKGMYHELIGQVQRAHQLLEHSASLDPNFIEPKREMSFIKQNYGSQRQNAFTDEISVVVTKFFKKKSS
jgi:curved DNA-binding protein CbpA